MLVHWFLKCWCSFLPSPVWKWKWKLLSHVWLFATPWTSPWNSPGQNTGFDSLSILQGIFPTQGSNPGLPHCRQILYQLRNKGSPREALFNHFQSALNHGPNIPGCIPIQYCSLQHQTLLPTSIKSTPGCCFCVGSISSFFLELVLHWSPVAYWAPTNLGSSFFSVLSFNLFYFSWGTQGKNIEVVCHSLLQWTTFC